MIKKRLYESEGRHASWLELFFDLIFVVFLGELIHSFGHTHHNHLDGAFFWKFPFLFLAIWWLWMQHTIYSNRFDNDGRIHRVLTLGVMLLIIIMNGVVSRGLEKNFVFFTILFISIQAIYLVMYMRVDNQDKSDSLFIKNQIKIISSGIVLFIIAAFIPQPFNFILFLVGMFIQILVPVFLLKSSAIKNIDREHFIERLGLLVIILLGESIISISYSLREIDFSQAVISNAFVGFLLIGAVWWIYFDSLPLLQESHNDPKGYVLILTHVFVCIGFGIVANAISHAILNNLITSEFRILLLIGLLLLYFGKQTPYFFIVPEYRRYILLNSVSVFAIYSLSFLTESKFLILSLTTLALFLYIALNYRAQRQLYGKVYL